MKGMGEFLGSALIKEIDSMPRRLVHTAREQFSSQDDQQLAQKFIFDLIKNFLDEERRAMIRDAENSSKLSDCKILSI